MFGHLGRNLAPGGGFEPRTARRLGTKSRVLDHSAPGGHSPGELSPCGESSPWGIIPLGNHSPGESSPRGIISLGNHPPGESFPWGITPLGNHSLGLPSYLSRCRHEHGNGHGHLRCYVPLGIPPDPSETHPKGHVALLRATADGATTVRDDSAVDGSASSGPRGQRRLRDGTSWHQLVPSWYPAGTS